jgi:hypothetical protein
MKVEAARVPFEAQALVGEEIAAEFGEIVGPRQVAGEQIGEAGEAGVDRIATHGKGARQSKEEYQGFVIFSVAETIDVYRSIFLNLSDCIARWSSGKIPSALRKNFLTERLPSSLAEARV